MPPFSAAAHPQAEQPAPLPPLLLSPSELLAAAQAGGLRLGAREERGSSVRRAVLLAAESGEALGEGGGSGGPAAERPFAVLLPGLRLRMLETR